VADFLSTEWFQSLNESLEHTDPVPFDDGAATVRVVIEFPDAPSNGPHAITFSIGTDGARVEAGDHLAADAIVQIAYADAAALTNGDVDSASALRDGRVKVRGDINAIVPLLSWLQRAHPNAN
jgi:putative sterol carrier protein